MSEGQGIQVGTVVSVSGDAVRVCVLENLDIERIPLQPGERVHQQQVLETGPDSQVVVKWDDGKTWLIESGQRVEVVAGFHTDDIEYVESGVDTDEVDPDVAAIQDALARGVDPSELEATAAGNSGGGNDDGTRVIILDRGNQSDPYQSFETPDLDTDSTRNDPRDGDVVPPDDLPAATESGPLQISVITYEGRGEPPNPQLRQSMGMRPGGQPLRFMEPSGKESEEPTLEDYLQLGYTVFELRLSASSSEPVSVDYSVVSGTATGAEAGLRESADNPNEDFILVSGTAEFAPGETSVLVPVQILGDTWTEGSESLSIVLENPVSADLATTSASAEIADNDFVRFNIDSDVNFVFDEAVGAWEAQFKVYYDGKLADGVEATVQVSTSDGSALNTSLAPATGSDALLDTSDDYLNLNDVLEFVGGDSNEQTIAITLGEDVSPLFDGSELEEYFSLSLGGTSSNAVLGQMTVAVAAVDDFGG